LIASFSNEEASFGGNKIMDDSVIANLKHFNNIKICSECGVLGSAPIILLILA
jgi:hypothetical protein